MRRAVSSQEKSRARSSPAADEPVAVLERAPDGRAEVAVLGVDGRVAGHLAQRRLGGGDDGRAARHRLEHGQAEPLEARRQDERGRAAVELGELLPVET